jgi:hypothetical protein
MKLPANSGNSKNPIMAAVQPGELFILSPKTARENDKGGPACGDFPQDDFIRL